MAKQPKKPLEDLVTYDNLQGFIKPFFLDRQGVAASTALSEFLLQFESLLDSCVPDHQREKLRLVRHTAIQLTCRTDSRYLSTSSQKPFGEYVNRASALGENYSLAFFLAETLFKRGLLKDAWKAYEQIIHSDIKQKDRVSARMNADGIINLLEPLSKRFNVDYAETTCKHILNTDPALADGSLISELVHAVVYQREDTRGRIRKFIEGVAPRVTDEELGAATHFVRGSLALRQRDGATAEGSYKLALQKDIGLTTNLIAVGKHYFEISDPMFRDYTFYRESGLAFQTVLNAHKGTTTYDAVSNAIKEISLVAGLVAHHLVYHDSPGAVEVVKAARDRREYKQAIAGAEFILGSVPKESKSAQDALYFAGTAAEAKGDYPIARNYALRLLEVGPKHSSGQQLLQRVEKKLASL
ncbi:hypothetical protein HYX12_04825 [Candidatus Woesearchaeota archaeon]|nr:hypothetical protein [Candidatus Woesearchaeota archaeon]